jgi:hypothetical protein
MKKKKKIDDDDDDDDDEFVVRVWSGGTASIFFLGLVGGCGPSIFLF